LNGGEQDTLPIVVSEEVRIELDNQLCVRGDGFEQLLQPTAFEFLDCPLRCFKIFEVAIDVKGGFKNDLPLLTSGMEGLGVGSRSLRGGHSGLRHLESCSGLLSNRWCAVVNPSGGKFTLKFF
jgi:hypothetical protein